MDDRINGQEPPGDYSWCDLVVSTLILSISAKVLCLGLLVLTSSHLTGLLRAQPIPDESERFEVASIRPGSVNDGRPAMEFTPGGGLRATNVTLKLLIELAYEIRPEQLSGGAGWTGSEQYTVIAKGPEALSAAEQKALTLKRLRGLLAERFQLAIPSEASQASGYVLTVEKKGHKMAVADHDPASRQLRQVGRWEIRAQGVEMPLLARFLGVHLQATVVDRTGLEGRYSFRLNWTPVPLPSSVAALNGLPEESLIPAVREQLGLRLERQKTATDRYTIEHAEKPTEN
ncbi:MAG: TIGR03435 family protein [Acidobacteria bacterium]|nr:TIGR03435 family protein [Acidobacteriota bacterium]